MGKTIKIYGERNTGTNYLQQLIELNFDADLLNGGLPNYINNLLDLGQLKFPSLFKLYDISERIRDKYFEITSSKNLDWKHTMISTEVIKKIQDFDKSVFFITLTKNPYSWLLSLYNKPYHVKKEYSNFEQFLTEPWEPVKREHYSKTFKNPIEIWNMKNNSYIELKNNFHAINVTYEELLSNPEKLLDKISEFFNITKINRTFQNIKKSTKEKDKDFDYYQNYYLNEIWKKKLSNKTIGIINNSLDDYTMNYFGYKKIEI